MDENIFWDRKISKSKLKKTLSNDKNARFVDFASLLLARTNDIKMIFSSYIKEEAFCRNWQRIKRKMRQDKWNETRIDYWDQVYQVVKDEIGFKKGSYFKKTSAEFPPEVIKMGKAVKEARKKAGMTQKKLSQVSGISQQMISLIESGRSSFSVDTLTKVMNAVGLELAIRRKEEGRIPSTGSITSTSYDTQ